MKPNQKKCHPNEEKKNRISKAMVKFTEQNTQKRAIQAKDRTRHPNIYEKKKREKKRDDAHFFLRKKNPKQKKM